MDFIEIAKYCQGVFKEAHNTNNDKYASTIFVAINGEQVSTSRTPHILQNADKCILIHEYRELAVSSFYSWYTIETIDEEGCVLLNRIDDEFELNVYALGSYANQRMELSTQKKSFYSCGVPFEANIKKVLKLYFKIKDIKSNEERALISDLFSKNESILELEKQIEDFKFANELLKHECNQYKSLLDDIKKLISSN